MTDSDLFQLDPRLAATSIAVGRRAGIEVRLVNDSRYQWLMLVPCLPDIVEIDDLPRDVAADLFRLAGDLGSWLKSFAAADKIKRENIDLKNQASLLCSEVEKELATSNLSEDEQQEINTLIGEIKQNIQDDNIDSLKLLIEDLKEKLNGMKSSDTVNM